MGEMKNDKITQFIYAMYISIQLQIYVQLKAQKSFTTTVLENNRKAIYSYWLYYFK